jgi:hypothetical protein
MELRDLLLYKTKSLILQKQIKSCRKKGIWNATIAKSVYPPKPSASCCGWIIILKKIQSFRIENK